MSDSHVIDALLSQPWAILPAKLSAIVDLVVRHSAGMRLSAEELRAYSERARPQAMYYAVGSSDVFAAAPPRGAQRGGVIAVLPLMGTILPRAGVLDAMSGAASLQDFRAQLRAAMADPSISAIVIDVDSPGGSVALVEETGAEIRAARDSKPITAVADTIAASAAFWLAAQAGRFVVTPSGEVGSVGVVAAHEDISRALDQEGVNVTLFATSQYKTEGNPYQPLGEDARTEIMRVLQSYQTTFERELARGRGVPVGQVREQFGQGRMALPEEAVSRGMADEVGTLEDVLASFGRRGGAAAPGARSAAAGAEHEGIEVLAAADAVVPIDNRTQSAALAAVLERQAVTQGPSQARKEG